MATVAARLYAILQNTGWQQKDFPTYQFLRALIDNVVALQNSSSGSGGGGSTTIIEVSNNLLNPLLIEGLDGEDGFPGPPGINGSGSGDSSFVPYFIASGETFTVPLYDQALFSMNIDNEGILDIEGFLIEVD